MNDGWKPFEDSHGTNNSFPTQVRGFEFHVHGKDFEGPASLKFGDLRVQTMTAGEALYRAAMIQVQQQQSQQQHQPPPQQ